MMTLDEATDYLETLRTPIDPSIGVYYRRPEDWRRKKMAENNSPIRMYDAHVSIQSLPDALKTHVVKFEQFKASSPVAEIAIAEVIAKVKAYFSGSDLA